MDAPDLELALEIPRPPAEVRAWWLDFADDYVSSDPREQPHRIRVRARRPDGMDVDTYWLTPLSRNLLVPESFRFRPDGWDIDIRRPLGLAQRDRFVLEPTTAGTRVRIQVWVRSRTLRGRLARPAFLRYARRWYPATWRTAAKLCARDAPRIAGA